MFFARAQKNLLRQDKKDTQHKLEEMHCRESPKSSQEGPSKAMLHLCMECFEVRCCTCIYMQLIGRSQTVTTGC